MTHGRVRTVDRREWRAMRYRERFDRAVMRAFEDGFCTWAEATRAISQWIKSRQQTRKRRVARGGGR